MALLFAPYLRSSDQINAPIPGAFLSFYQTQTSTPQPIYADVNLTVPLQNPLPSDANGVWPQVWLDDSLPPYKIVYQYPDINDPTVPGAIVAGPNGTLDPYNSTVSATGLNKLLNPQIQAETDANVTVIDFGFPVLHVDRYGKNTNPGTTAMTTAWQAACNVAKKQGGVVRWGVGPYLIDAPLDLTNPPGSQNCTFALIGEGRFKAPTNTPGQNATPSIILKHVTPGHAFDTTGSLGIHFENMSVCTDEVNYPKTCFFLARNSDGGSRTDRIINCYVLGRFSETVLYNYGCENGVYLGNQFYNISADTDISAADFTGFNARNETSTFTTIASGSQSCLDHKIFGGEYAVLFQGVGTSADAFRFDGARSIKIYGIWVDSSAKNGLSAGRSLFYIDGRHAALSGLVLSGIDGEAALHSANYGILVSPDTQTHGNILIQGCYFPNSTATIGGGANATLSGLTWINSTNSSQGGNIIFNGAFVNSFFDASASTVSAGSIDNFTNTLNGSATLQAAGRVGLNLRDSSQASGSQWVKLQYNSAHTSIVKCDDVGASTATLLDISTSGIGFNNTSAVSKPTISGSRGSNAALASLLTALASMGLITDSSS